MKNSLLLLLILVVVACKSESTTPKQNAVSNEELIMYQASEMALLMEQMFTENEQLKVKILSGEDLGEFNSEYLKIHSAILTKPSDRNEVFTSFSKAFLSSQESIFQSDSIPVKEKFNTMVQTCIACHQTNCIDVIPRIEKLIIK